MTECAPFLIIAVKGGEVVLLDVLARCVSPTIIQTWYVELVMLLGISPTVIRTWYVKLGMLLPTLSYYLDHVSLY